MTDLYPAFSVDQSTGLVQFEHAGARRPIAIVGNAPPPGADANGLVDSTAAIQAAMNNWPEFVLAPGNYLVGALDCGGRRLIGSGQAATTLVPVGNIDLFNFRSSYSEVGSFFVDCSRRTGGSDFVTYTATGPNLTNIKLRDMTFEQSMQAWRDAGTSGVYVELDMQRVRHLKHRGPGYVMTRGFGFLRIYESCVLEFIGASSPNYDAFDFDGSSLGAAAGGLFLGLQLGGTAGTTGTTTAQRGFIINNAAEIHFWGARADTLGGAGAIISGCNNVYFDESPYFGLCGGVQLTIQNTSYVYGGGFTARGDLDRGGSSGLANVVIADPATIVSLDTINSQGSSGDGMRVDAGSSTTVNIGRFSGIGCSGAGFRTTGAGGVVTVNGGLLASNGSNYALTGANHHLLNMTLNSGSVASADGPSNA